IPLGPVVETDPANQSVVSFGENTSTAGSQTDVEFFRLTTGSGPASPLRSGTNLLAVEIHQANVTSSDISFDLELNGSQPNAAPSISLQPKGRNVPAGGTVALSVGALGAPPLSYQWRLQGQELPDATNAILVLENLVPDQSGTYSVVVSNAFGSLTSVD